MLNTVKNELATWTATAPVFARMLFEVTKETFSLEPRKATLLSLILVVRSFCGYFGRFVQALMLSCCIQAVQNKDSVSKGYFMLLLGAQAVLLGLEDDLGLLRDKVFKDFDLAITWKRHRNLLRAYFSLSFLEQTTANNRNQFTEARADIQRSGQYFQNVVITTCGLIETVVGLFDIVRRLAKCSPVLGSISLVGIIAWVWERFKTRHTKEIFQPGELYSSSHERRADFLCYFPLRGDREIQDLNLNQATPWLLKMFEQDAVQVKHYLEQPTQWGLEVLSLILDSLEVLGVPCLILILGVHFDLDDFAFTQRALSAVNNNLSFLNWKIRDLQDQAIPFARNYLACTRRRRNAKEENPQIIPAMQTLEVRNLFFTYAEKSRSEPTKSDDLRSPDTPREGSLKGDKKEHLHDDKDVGPEMDRWALQDFSFRFENGKVYSIVGKNGSGKSTLVKLLTKLIPPSKGRILVNGIDVNSASRDDWLKQVAAVTQETELISNISVGQNISFGGDFSEDVIKAEATLCGVTEFVDLNCYFGDDTELLEAARDPSETWQSDFSGGEWQSISLARGFCRARTAKLFILDEPSSELDPEREFELFSRLRKEREGRITIFISHNLKTCRASDCILVMDDGKLLESGSHVELLARDGKYSSMYKLQEQSLTEGEEETKASTSDLEKIEMRETDEHVAVLELKG
jgi:ABC-type multidrug transport system fused ATPase/permease subunit